MDISKEIAQKIGDISLAMKIQRILEGLTRGKLPSLLLLMSVARSLLSRCDRLKRLVSKIKEIVKRY